MLKFSTMFMIFVAHCAAMAGAGESYQEVSTISVSTELKKDPKVIKGTQKYRIEGDSLYITRDDGTEYFYNTILATSDVLRFTCGNKYLVFANAKKESLVVSHIDEVESKIVFLRKAKR